MDEQSKREIIDALTAAITSSKEETAIAIGEVRVLVDKAISDQVIVRSELAEIRTRVEALESARNAHENRLSGHEHKIREGVAEAARLASETRAEVDGTLAGVEQRHEELGLAIAGVRDTVARIDADVTEIKTNVEAAVLRALGKHVARIEEAANRLTKTPQVRTAAAVGGTFAGSALVTIIIEILKHL